MTKHLNWFALLTRSNFEQTVYGSITGKKIDAFLPKARRQSLRKDRKLMIEIPLFPGYLFVRTTIEPADQLNILKTTGAVRILGNTGGPLSIPDSQIDALKLLTSANVDLISGKSILLKKGDPVMVLEGPMAGLKGEFTRHKGCGRVIVKIDILGQYAGVEMDLESVEKIPDFIS
ncbi:MAG: UpxY family transcription antiterminator [Proteobacteria bacterium]|nr:UpxY family transcription antiterminator [Desulfobacula sp.]MBU3952652.1 UpxY family transcription antiterminator [Pseudomonadota bacterium]MBU4130037.1 UpxY family transcription antiterminator [Pseudomonadota bacterium]